MDTTDARRWLALCGIHQVGDGWVDDEEPDVVLSAESVAHDWAGAVFRDEDMAPTEQTRLAFGLLDLLDQLWVAFEISFAHKGAEGPLPAYALWNGYRERLEAVRDAENVTYSLWNLWFEDRSHSATAFAEVLGNDIERVVAVRSDPMLRRTRRVLECSGPVAWSVKELTYLTAAWLPDLHPALFRALLMSYHNYFGDLDPPAALALLDRLELPESTEHRAELRHVLRAGRTNHYADPGAWDDAVRATAHERSSVRPIPCREMSRPHQE